MIQHDALFKISYGLYILSSGNRALSNACIVNTLFQVTAEPPLFSVCCNKDNYTSEFIINSGFFVASVLEINTPSDIFGRFGYKSGRDIDKFHGMEIQYSENSVPYIVNSSLAFMEYKLINTYDLKTHWMFIGQLLNAEILNPNLEPITYLHYKQTRNAVSPKNAPTYIAMNNSASATDTFSEKSRYKCTACGYVYEEKDHSYSFSALPEDWLCPVCGAGKEDFIML